MNSIRTIPLAVAPLLPADVRPWRINGALAVAVAVFLAVVIADVAMIAMGAPSIAAMDPSSITAM